MSLLTIITPTYNRGAELKHCWESLRSQTNKNFQWLIIDDGSTDNTSVLINEFKKHNYGFTIDHYYKQNGGKHTALNFSHPYIKGDIVLILDSDDLLINQAVEIVLNEWQKLVHCPEIGGVTFMRSQDGHTPLAMMPKNTVLSDHINFRINQHITGDCCETLRTSVFTSYSFPEIAGEHFLGEGMLWTTLSFSYQTLYLNRILYIVPEYRSDGLTKAGRRLRINNPQGSALNAELHMDKRINTTVRIKNALLKSCYSFFLHKRPKDILKETNYSFLVGICLPAGYLLYLFWLRKYGVSE